MLTELKAHQLKAKEAEQEKSDLLKKVMDLETMVRGERVRLVVKGCNRCDNIVQ